MPVDIELFENQIYESTRKLSINHNKSFKEYNYTIVHILSVHILKINSI